MFADQLIGGEHYDSPAITDKRDQVLDRWDMLFLVSLAKSIVVQTGSEVIKLFSCSAQLRLKFILLINVKMPTIVGILTFMSRINYRLWGFKPLILIYLGFSNFMSN